MPFQRKDTEFMRACSGAPVSRTPVWLMRQAGRYMPEYRAIRERVCFLELCKSPELACEVTVFAQRTIGADAAILFADMLPILEPMGFELSYHEQRGPLIGNPLRSTSDLARLRIHDASDTMPFLARSVELTRAALDPHIPLIGFAGLPFTLAAYAIEGGASRNFENTKRLMYDHPQTWHNFLGLLVRTIVPYLRAQVAAGVDALQVFDSWVGCLSPKDYRCFALPHTRAVIQELQGTVPIIHFGVGTATLLADMHEAGADVLGLDWRVGIADVRARLGTGRASRVLQGNLDPVALLCQREPLLAQAQAVLEDNGGAPGYIFNLGHGILPATPVDNVKALIDFVHQWRPTT